MRLKLVLHLYSHAYTTIPVNPWVYYYTYTPMGTLLYQYPHGYITQSDKQQKNDVFTRKKRTFLLVKEGICLHKKSSG
jgi:hypothetical protein